MERLVVDAEMLTKLWKGWLLTQRCWEVMERLVVDAEMLTSYGKAGC